VSDNDELDFFMANMADVAPIKSNKTVQLKPNDHGKPGLLHRQRAAVEDSMATAHDPLSGDNDSDIPRVNPLEVLTFQRPGVQHGVFKSLRLGKYQVESRLDLHRLDVEQARRTVFLFVRDCLQHDIRCALINHGKGEGRKSAALLKSCVAHWLPQIPEILAFHSAQPHHGGSGATYILLKKSERKRQENFERHTLKIK